MRVLHTRHWKHGDNGEYFYFSAIALDKMLGRTDWNGETFDIIQAVSQDWRGEVQVWRFGMPNGRRVSGNQPGQWQAGDIIALQEHEYPKEGRFTLIYIDHYL